MLCDLEQPRHKAAVLLCAMTVCASSQCIEAAVWAETNGVCSALIGWRETVGAITNGVVRGNDELLFVISPKTGPLDFSLPEDKAYTIRTKMLGADGKEVPKTYPGKNYGSKFDELRNNSEIRQGGLAVFGPHIEDPTLGRSIILLKPDDVFNITKPPPSVTSRTLPR